MLKQQVGAEAVDGLGAAAVELQQVVALDILVDAVQVVDGPCVLRFGVEEVAAEGHIRAVVAQVAQHRWHDVNLLRYGVAHSRLYLARRVEEYDGRTESAQVGLVIVVVREVGVV